MRGRRSLQLLRIKGKKWNWHFLNLDLARFRNNFFLAIKNKKRLNTILTRVNILENGSTEHVDAGAFIEETDIKGL